MKPTRFLLPATLTLLLAASAWWTARLATRYQRQLKASRPLPPASSSRPSSCVGNAMRFLHRLATARQQPAPAVKAATGRWSR